MTYYSMKIAMLKLKLLVATLLFISTSLLAQNTGGVFGPSVNDGHKSFQYRMALEPDGVQGETGFAQRFHYQQSIDGDFRWRILGQTRKTQDSDTDFDFVQAELLWQLDETDDYLSGVRFDARLRDNSRPYQIGFNWIHQYNLEDNWQARFLVLTSIQFGNNSADGIGLQTRASIWKRVSIGQLGIEMFNNYGSTEEIPSFSKQKHTIGPFISKSIGKDGWSIFAGLLFGITDAAPDRDFRFWITKRL